MKEIIAHNSRYEYEIINIKTGKIHSNVYLKGFCEKHKLNLSSIHSNFNNYYNLNSINYKGWTIKRKRKNQKYKIKKNNTHIIKLANTFNKKPTKKNLIELENYLKYLKKES